MNRVRVKICGMTRSDDVRFAAQAGADMLGFVFAQSARRLTLRQATGLLETVPEHITRVALFMNPKRKEVAGIVQTGLVDLLQFHGDEDNDFCASFGLPFIKAVAMGDGGRQVDVASLYPDAQGLLYDSHAPGGAGGSGRTFDWSLVPRDGQRIWLAGGLNPDNVAQAIMRCRPWAVDVSSGVEDAPGIKNHELVKAFIDRARSVQIEEQERKNP